MGACPLQNFQPKCFVTEGILYGNARNFNVICKVFDFKNMTSW